MFAYPTIVLITCNDRPLSKLMFGNYHMAILAHMHGSELHALVHGMRALTNSSLLVVILIIIVIKMFIYEFTL